MKQSISFLPQKSDYIQFVLCVAQINMTKKRKTVFFLFGLFFIAAGALLWAFSPKDAGTGSLFVWIGLLLCLFCPFLYPLFLRLRADSFFEHHREKMNAVTFLFEEESFSVVSDRYQLRDYPYEKLYRVREYPQVFLFLLSRAEIKYLPKRVLTEEDRQWLMNKFTYVGK